MCLGLVVSLVLGPVGGSWWQDLFWLCGLDRLHLQDGRVNQVVRAVELVPLVFFGLLQVVLVLYSSFLGWVSRVEKVKVE